ncbi:MAG: FkbM family methyltransferase [Gaiellaceae bacterium]
MRFSTNIKRFLSIPVVRALDRFPALEQLTSAHTHGRRLQIALTRLRRRGLLIETVYDIGAHRGAWTNGVRESLPGTRFFLFEANDAHAEDLDKTGERYFTEILSSEEKEVEFFGMGTSGDSYLRELTDRYATAAPTTRRATTLDRMVELHQLPYPDFIKVDVQGAELDVLAGGATALSHAKLVLLECPILPYNAGAPTIDAYFGFMDRKGFTVLEFVDELWPDGRMRHVDVLFARVSHLDYLNQ